MGMTSISLLDQEEDQVDGPLSRLDSWYAYYHRHWWCRRRQFTRFKRAQLWWNGFALLIMASGLVVGPVLKNTWVVAGLAAVGTLVKGWIEFRQWGTLVQMSRFAYTTYAKTLIELRTWARGGGEGDPTAFLIKMQTLDDMVTDFVPPLTETYRKAYEAQYVYRPLPSIKVQDPCPDHVISVCLPSDDVDGPRDAVHVDDDDNNKAVSCPSLLSSPRLSLQPEKPRP